MKQKIQTALLLLSIVAAVGQSPAFAADPANAVKLYGLKQYAASADEFEKVFTTAKPEARLYYYAGLANSGAQRTGRAKQLFYYVATNFPNTKEAELAQSALALLAPNGIAPGSTKVGPASTMAAASKISGTGAEEATAASISSSPLTSALSGKTRKKGAYVFTPEEIAREGAEGIDQTNAPNCWFECSMSALAQLPKGQRMLAKMITYDEGDGYIVRFPGDGVEYKIDQEKMARAGVKSTALWASLLDYAERCKFPGNMGVDNGMHRLQVGLSCITGCRADLLYPGQSSNQELSSFIQGAVSSGNPVTAGTSGRSGRNYVPVFEGHAYTVIGFDPSRNMVTIRNPHGHKSHIFSMPSDPNHMLFENLDDGIFKMHLDLFREAFGSVCRSNI